MLKDYPKNVKLNASLHSRIIIVITRAGLRDAYCRRLWKSMMASP